jgi:hypothetical protein
MKEQTYATKVHSHITSDVVSRERQRLLKIAKVNLKIIVHEGVESLTSPYQQLASFAVELNSLICVWAEIDDDGIQCNCSVINYACQMFYKLSVLDLIQTSKHCVNGLCVGTCDKSQFLLTAGSDMRIRYWDMNFASNSQIIVNAATDPVHSSTTVSYR